MRETNAMRIICGPPTPSLGPTVETVGVRTDVVKSHLCLRLLRVGLEKYGFSVAAFWAGVVLQGNRFLIGKLWDPSSYLRSGQGWVGDYVSDDVGDGVHFVHDLVHVNTAAVSHLPVVAVPG